MSPEGDRRATGAARVPFDALVEVGGELGPSFEAQAVDISEHGMHLRTAYLPDVGQPLQFRFDAGPGRQFVAAGEVTWREELGKGGEFGVRFTNLDHESAAALSRILGPPAAQSPGSRVRLHIDGLASPMRARVKEASQAEITAFSELGFLQVGKQLELEDAQTGAKRPACIDRVDVEIDRESRVPQLVVTLRYEDVSAPEPAPEPIVEAPSEPAPEPAPVEAAAAPVIEEEIEVPMEDAASRMRSAFARGAAKVGPAFANAMKRAKVTVALLAAKRKAGRDDAPLRRTTAPPPGGALHAAGRKVVRSEPEEAAMPEVKKLVTKRRAIVAGAVGVAAVLAFVALKKPAPQAPLASAPPPEATASTVQSPELTTPVAASPLGPLDPSSLSSGAKDDVDHSSHKKNLKVAPFGNGPVAHGSLLHLKMDGSIEKIEGAQQPNGFTVVIPNRRSLEPAGPLAARDTRIASIRVSNDPNGAELSLAFKDGVPNYQVRAKGDTLEIVLAPVGPVADGKSHVQAKHGDADGKPHGKAHKNKSKD